MIALHQPLITILFMKMCLSPSLTEQRRKSLAKYWRTDMPRSLPRSRQQLERTTHSRTQVFEFMRRFNAKELWCINGPLQTDCDEIMCFAYAGGVAIVQTWQAGGWSIYTEPTNSADLETTFRAIEAQTVEKQDEGKPTMMYQRSRVAIALAIALKGALLVIDDEIEQRKHGGNAEYWKELTKLSDNSHKALAYAEGKIASVAGENALQDLYYTVNAPLVLSQKTRDQIEKHAGLPIISIEEVELVDPAKTVRAESASPFEGKPAWHGEYYKLDRWWKVRNLAGLPIIYMSAEEALVAAAFTLDQPI